MDARWKITLLLGPGQYPGMLPRDWLRLLRDNRWGVSPRYVYRALAATGCVLMNAPAAAWERWRFGAKVANVSVPPPLFVLGHYRGGTTHLHHLLAADPRFAAPNLYQVLCPHTFLTTEAVSSRLLAPLLPRGRLFDAVRQTFDMPYEDEMALATMTLRSPYLGLAFPRRAAHYDRFLTFDGATEQDVAAWSAALVQFAKKLTWKYGGRPLVLKSPPHTARIKLLLDLFPQAKFVHIRRDPYAVFRSTMHLLERGLPAICFQSDALDLERRVLSQYREMYDAYFAQRGRIPPGHLHELEFEELEADPVGTLRTLYDALSLPPFDEAEPAVRRYLESVGPYRKNVFAPLDEPVRQRVASEWRRCFEAWGYPT